MLTGERRVLRADIMMDAGNSLSPAIDAGQVCPIPLFELLSCKVLTFHCCLGFARRVLYLWHPFIGVLVFAALLCPCLHCCPNFGLVSCHCWMLCAYIQLQYIAMQVLIMSCCVGAG